MRFSVPRSLSPSPVRNSSRKRSTYGVPSESDEDSDNDDRSRSSSSSLSSSESSSLLSSSDSEPDNDNEDAHSDSSVDIPTVNMNLLRFHQPPQTSPKVQRNALERVQTEETIAAIRLRTRHHDPYEEWEKQTRKDAFKSAQIDQSTSTALLATTQAAAHAAAVEKLERLHTQQMHEVRDALARVNARLNQQESGMREMWEKKDRAIREGIEEAIREEEGKARAAMEKAKKEQEEKEAKQRAIEEAKKKEEEEKKQAEEKKKQEEEAQKLKEEEERLRNALKVKQQEAEQSKREETHRQKQEMGLANPFEAWHRAHEQLRRFKAENIASVKSNPPMKSEFAAVRRQLNPKVGQLLTDLDSVNTICNDILSIMQNAGSRPIAVSTPLLPQAHISSLAKVILLQTETEVPTEPRAAVSLAHLSCRLMRALPALTAMMEVRIEGRVGGWAWGIGVQMNTRGAKAEEGEVNNSQPKVDGMGYRRGETLVEYTARVTAVMRLYFNIIKVWGKEASLQDIAPLEEGGLIIPFFQLSSYWTWFSRILNDRGMLEKPLTAQLIFVGLDVLGSEARSIWGHQWIKVLQLIYEGVTTGLPIAPSESSSRMPPPPISAPPSSAGSAMSISTARSLGGTTEGKFKIGGETPEGVAARMRVQLEVERIMNGVK